MWDVNKHGYYLQEKNIKNDTNILTYFSTNVKQNNIFF